MQWQQVSIFGGLSLVNFLLHQWKFDELPIIIPFSSIFEVVIWLKFARKRNTAINIANCKSICPSLEGIF
jgi:hypothetical protein